MLVHRLRRWPNIEPAMAGRVVVAGMVNVSDFDIFLISFITDAPLAGAPKAGWNR